MAILVDKNTRVLIQGITGRVGSEFAKRMIVHGTNLVGGVTPGKGGQNIDGAHVFDTVKEAVIETQANASMIVVPPRFVKDAVFEALNSDIKIIVIYTEKVPIHDAIDFISFGMLKGAHIIGPNTAGIVSPGNCNMSDINPLYVKPGNVGIISKSGTLAYEYIDHLYQRNLGQSTVCCLGGDLIIGMKIIDTLKLFEDDIETKGVLLLGEVGGTEEVDALDYIKNEMSKPVVSFINGQYVPIDKKIGHAGAIITRGRDTAKYKIEAFREKGLNVGITIKSTIDLLIQELNKM